MEQLVQVLAHQVILTLLLQVVTVTQVQNLTPTALLVTLKPVTLEELGAILLLINIPQHHLTDIYPVLLAPVMLEQTKVLVQVLL